MKKIFLIFLVIVINNSFAQNERIKITGEFNYNYGDNESLIEAKHICYTMALRNAIETYQVFITSTIKDYTV